MTSQTVIYVSKVKGNDSTFCGSQDSPCYSISQAISQAQFGSSIYLDSTNTTTSPYDCQPLTSYQKGIYVTKALSFVGGPSLVHISCKKGQDWIVNGTLSPITINANFTGIAFQNSRLHFVETAIAVDHCVFSNTEKLVMNFTILHRNLTRFSFKNVRFEENEACILVTSISINTKDKPFISIYINDSVFNNNGRRRVPIVPSLSSTILGADTSGAHFVDIQIQNSSFQRNYVRSSGMIYVNNKLGCTNFLIQHVNFTENGLHDRTTGNSLFVLKSPIVSLVISQSQVKKSKQRLLSIYSTWAALNVSHTTVDDFINPQPFPYDCGGAFYMKSKVIKLFINHCFFRNGIAHNRGGLLFVLTHNASILIENSTVTNLTSGAYGGVIHATSRHSLKIVLTGKNVTFTRNGAIGDGGVMSFKCHVMDVSLYFTHVLFEENYSREASGGAICVYRAPSNESSSFFTLTATHVRFIGNRADGPGGAVYVELNFRSTLVFNHVTFLNNIAQGGDGGAICAGYDNFYLAPSLEILIKRCRFENNTANGGGAIHVEGQNGVFASEHSIFRSNVAMYDPGGALQLQMWNSTINLVNATFFNNTAGGAMYLDIRNESRVHIDHAKFERNIAFKYYGAGVAIITSGDTLHESGCHGKAWRAWNYSNLVEIKNTHFVYNYAGRGGAVSMTDGSVNFTNCTFFNNVADIDQGNHITNYGTNSLNLVNCTFQQKYSPFMYSFIQTFSTGPLVLSNTTVDQWEIFKSRTLLMVSKGGLVELNDLTSIMCPSGMFASWLNLSYNDWINSSCSLKVTLLRLQCNECERGTYSLQRGHTRGFRVVDDFKCLTCPYGAECFPTIKSKPNFWGYFVDESPPSLHFILCPEGYCRSGMQSPDGYSNSCNGTREDWMCGRCASGYSEMLFSADCKRSEDCNDNWFWLVFVALVFVIALFLVFKPPIVTFAAKQAFWFQNHYVTKKQENVVDETESVAALQTEENESTFLLSTEEIENEKLQAVGFLEIIFYFYQISNLLLTSTTWEQVLKTKVLIPIQGFFNFQGRFFGHESLICPFPGLTPETKQLFELAPVFGTLGAIYFIYILHYILCKIFRTATPTLGRYLGATMETMLLGYIKIANVSLSLIRCVPVGSESRWFYNGTIVCYQWWQNVLIAFNVMVVAPFIFVLAWGAVKLHREKVSAKHFLLACVFPLPFLILWLLQSLGFYGNQRQHAQSTEYTEALKDVLLAPFREPEEEKTGALYWQSIFIVRRFTLVFLYCFITDPTLRLFCMGLVCVLALLHHSSMKPFRTKHANIGETISLLALVILANINLYKMHKSFYTDSKNEISDNWIPVFQALDWIEIILLGFLPAICALVVLLASISVITRLIFVVSASIYARIHEGLTRSNERTPLVGN